MDLGVGFMFERAICVFAAILSFLGVFYTSKNMDIYTDVSTVAKSNYVDVYFTNINSENGSRVSITPSKREIEVSSISISKMGDWETIHYELFNNSSSYDVEVSYLVNGEEFYENELFMVEVDEGKRVNSGETLEGDIIITLKKNVSNLSFPIIIDLNIQPIQKGYLS